MNALLAMYTATAREYLRDRTALLLTMLLPLLMAGFFGLIFKGDERSAYVPAMLGLGFLWLGVFGVAPPLVQMREQQVLRRLGATPLPRTTLLGAQIGWRLTTGLLQGVVLVLFGILVYDMQIPAGNWPLLLAAVVLGGLVMITIGFLLAGLGRTNESVIALGQLVQFPMMFLSGTLFPLDMLPSFVTPIAKAMPLTYLSDALKQLMLGTTGMFALWVDFAVLGGVLVLLGALAVKCFRWE